MSKFPRDCWEKQCQYFHCYDMNIDDFTCFCDLLKIQCDECDEDYCNIACPIKENPNE